jgi:hypothetical protein
VGLCALTHNITLRQTLTEGALGSGADDWKRLGIAKPGPISRPCLYKIAHKCSISSGGPREAAMRAFAKSWRL